MYRSIQTGINLYIDDTTKELSVTGANYYNPGNGTVTPYYEVSMEDTNLYSANILDISSITASHPNLNTFRLVNCDSNTITSIIGLLPSINYYFYPMTRDPGTFDGLAFMACVQRSSITATDTIVTLTHLAGDTPWAIQAPTGSVSIGGRWGIYQIDDAGGLQVLFEYSSID